MANNELPKSKLHSQGMLRIHEDTEQLRYSPHGPNDRSTAKNQTSDAYLQPLSSYRVGAAGGIKAGTPVSLALLDDIEVDEVRNSSDPAIVPTNCVRYRWSIGLAQEPGAADASDASDPVRRFVHVVNHGKFTWDAKDLVDAARNKYIQFPPNDGINFLWTYDDVGKTVYVSNVEGKQGQLTLDITEAYSEGGSIITIGHLADAPIPNNPGAGSKLTIEVHTDGDSRSIQDSTEFDAYILVPAGETVIPNPGVTGNDSKLVCVKLLYDEAKGITYGKIITNEKDVLENDENSPVAAFVAEPGKDYANQKVVIHRFGIVSGQFGYAVGDTGKDLYLSNGMVSTTSGTALYEYKVGVVFEAGDPTRQRVLIDCRYPKFFKAFDPVGKVKPLYKSKEGEYLTDPGYVAVDVDKKYCIKRGGQFGVLEQEFASLAEVILHQGIAKFYDAGGVQVVISNSTTFADVDKAGYYFTLTSMIYEIGDQTIGAQIKYSREGSPEEMQYLWPMKAYSMVISGLTGGKPGRDPSTNLSSTLDITDLVKIGEARNGAINIDDFEVQMIIEQINPDGTAGPNNGVIIPPGINPVQFLLKVDSFVRVDENNNKFNVEVPSYKSMYCGYDWQLVKKETKNAFGEVVDMKYYLMLVTNPDSQTDVNAPTYVPDSDCRGVCWPGVAYLSAGTPTDRLPPPPYSVFPDITVRLLVRRRPVFYHSLILNQLYSDSTWNADVFTDGNNLGIKGGVFFGAGGTITEPGNTPYIDIRRANEFRMAEYGSVDSDKKYNNPQFPVTSEIHSFGQTITSAGLKAISQVFVRYYPRLDNGDRDLSKYEIFTKYDFDSNSISFSANLTGKWTSPPSAVDPTFANQNDPEAQRIRNKGRYMDFEVEVALDANKVPKEFAKLRSALKTLHEIPVNFFLYQEEIPDNNNDDTSLIKRISPIQSGLWDRVGDVNSLVTNVQSIYNKYNPAWFDGEILTGTNPFAAIGARAEAKGIEYVYNRPKEAENIRKEISYSYLSEKGVDFSMQYLQTCIGLLTQASQEAQNRLLGLERMLFGADAETIPGLVSGIDGIPYIYGSLALGLSDPGVGRMVGWLDKIELFEYDKQKANQGLFSVSSMYPIMKDLLFGTGMEGRRPFEYFYFPRWDNGDLRFSWLAGMAGIERPFSSDPLYNKFNPQKNTLLDPIKWLMQHLHKNVPVITETVQETPVPTDEMMMPKPFKPLLTTAAPEAIGMNESKLLPDNLFGTSDYDGSFFLDHKASNLSIYSDASKRLVLNAGQFEMTRWHGLPRGFIRKPASQIEWGISGGTKIKVWNEAAGVATFIDFPHEYPAQSISGLLHDFAQRFAFLQSKVFDQTAGIDPQYGMISRAFGTVPMTEESKTSTDEFYLRGFTGNGVWGNNQKAMKFYLAPKGNVAPIWNAEAQDYQWSYSSEEYDSPWWNAFAFGKTDGKITQMGKTKIIIDTTRGQYVGTRILVNNQSSPVAGRVTIDWRQYCSTKGATPDSMTDSLIVSSTPDSFSSYSKKGSTPDGYETNVASANALGTSTTYEKIDQNVAISIGGRNAANQLIPAQFVDDAQLTGPSPDDYNSSNPSTSSRPPNNLLVPIGSNERSSGFDPYALYVKAMAEKQMTGDDAKVVELEKPREAQLTSIKTTISDVEIVPNATDLDSSTFSIKLKQAWKYVTKTTPTSTKWFGLVDPNLFSSTIFLRQNSQNKISPANSNSTFIEFEAGYVKPGESTISNLQLSAKGKLISGILYNDLDEIKSRFALYKEGSSTPIKPTSVEMAERAVFDYPVRLEYATQSLFDLAKIVATYANDSSIADGIDHSTSNHFVYRRYKNDEFVDNTPFEDIQALFALENYEIVLVDTTAAEPDYIKVTGLSEEVSNVEAPIKISTNSDGRVVATISGIVPDMAYELQARLTRDDSTTTLPTIPIKPSDSSNGLTILVTREPTLENFVDERGKKAELSVEFSAPGENVVRSFNWLKYDVANDEWNVYGDDEVISPDHGLLGSSEFYVAEVTDVKTIASSIDVLFKKTQRLEDLLDKGLTVETVVDDHVFNGSLFGEVVEIEDEDFISITLKETTNLPTNPSLDEKDEIEATLYLPSTVSAKSIDFVANNGSKAEVLLSFENEDDEDDVTISIGAYSFTSTEGIIFIKNIESEIVVDAKDSIELSFVATEVGECDLEELIADQPSSVATLIENLVGSIVDVPSNKTGSNSEKAELHVALDSTEAFTIPNGNVLTLEIGGVRYFSQMFSIGTTIDSSPLDVLFTSETTGPTEDVEAGTEFQKIALLFEDVGVVETFVPTQHLSAKKHSSVAFVFVQTAKYQFEVNRLFSMKIPTTLRISEPSFDGLELGARIGDPAESTSDGYELWYHDVLYKKVTGSFVFDENFKVSVPHFFAPGRFRIVSKLLGGKIASGLLGLQEPIKVSSSDTVPVTIEYVGHDLGLDSRKGFLKTKIKTLTKEIVVEENPDEATSIVNLPIGPFKIISSIHDHSSIPEEYRSLTALYASVETKKYFASTNREFLTISFDLGPRAAKEWVLRNIDAEELNYVANEKESGAENQITDEDETEIRFSVKNELHKRPYPSNHANPNVRNTFMEPLWSKFSTKQVKSAVPNITSIITGYGKQNLSLWQPQVVDEKYPNIKGLSGLKYGITDKVVSENGSIADSIKDEAYWAPSVGQLNTVTSESSRTDDKDQRMMDFRQAPLSTDSVYFSVKDVLGSAKSGVEWYLPFEYVMTPFPDLINNTYWESLDGTPPSGFNPASSIFFNGGDSSAPQLVVTLKNEGLQPQSKDFVFTKVDVNPNGLSGSLYVDGDSPGKYVEIAKWEYTEKFNYYYSAGGTNVYYEMLEVTDLGKSPPFRDYLGFQSAQVTKKQFVKPVISLPLPPRVLALNGNNGRLEITIGNLSTDPNVKYEFLYSNTNNPTTPAPGIISMNVTGGSGNDTRTWTTSALKPGEKFYCWVKSTNVYGSQLHIGSEYGGLEVMVTSAIKGMFSIEGQITLPNGTSFVNADVSITNGSMVATVSTNSNGIYKFSDLPAGVYDIYVQSPQYSGTTRTEIITEPRTGVNLQLGESLYEIEGRVTLRSDSPTPPPASGALIELSGPTIQYTTADDDGYFSFKDSTKIKYGEYEYKVTYDGGNILILSNANGKNGGPIGRVRFVYRIDPNAKNDYYDVRFDRTALYCLDFPLYDPTYVPGTPSVSGWKYYDPENPIDGADGWTHPRAINFYSGSSIYGGGQNHIALQQTYPERYDPDSVYYVGNKTIPKKKQHMEFTWFEGNQESTDELVNVSTSHDPYNPSHWNNFIGTWAGDVGGEATTITFTGNAITGYGSWTSPQAGNGLTKATTDRRYMQGRVTVQGNRRLDVPVPYRLANILGRVSDAKGLVEGAKITLMQNGRYPEGSETDPGNPNTMIDGFSYQPVWTDIVGNFEIVGVSQTLTPSQLTIDMPATSTTLIVDDEGNMVETSGLSYNIKFYVLGDSLFVLLFI